MALAFGTSIRYKILTVLVIGILCLVPVINVIAQQSDLTSSAPDSETSPLQELGDKFHNSIKLLQNRFRIDHQVEEITMVFFRKYGSSPIVLVKPDGTKIFQTQADGENIFWYDSITYDLINIKNPTPGPWQAVGQLLPESRVMVISELKLMAEKLPEVIFSGEILKQTARLSNGGMPINSAEFRDVVTLDIKLKSTNNPDYNNFGTEDQTIATFKDDGRGMDEKPLDGVFTGQFNLAVANGQWTPVFVVSTPMLTREQVDEPLMLYPNPIEISMEKDGGGEGYHKLTVGTSSEHVDLSSLLIDGKVRFPNGDVQNFSLTESSPKPREHLIVNYEEGVYRVKITAFGNTSNGREFILDVPEYTFLVEAPLPIPVEPLPNQTSSEPNTLNNSTITKVVPEPEADMSSGSLISLILAINLIILLLGGFGIWLFTRPKRTSRISWLSKIKRMFAKKNTEELTPVASSKTESGIIDLSLPKEAK